MSATGNGGSTGTGYDASRIKPGTRLNGVYEIDRLIARGGMGEVYAGRAVETDVPVAIKMMRPELSADPAIVGLFRREAMALHQLRHETIVGYYLFSIDPDLQCAYLAMEFVPGRSLADVAHSNGPLGFDAVRILQKRLASGLQAAHNLGIIHRDVSSDNIIMPDGDPARARIIDFGIAKNTLGGSTIIGDGFAGKNNYISPEQIGLFGGKVTAKSDVYSLGLVLVEALLGRPLDMGGSLADVVVKREVVPDLTGVDQRMLPLIRGMLDPNPETRLSMAEVAEHEAGTSRHPLPPREVTVVKEPTRRHAGVMPHAAPVQAAERSRLPMIAIGSGVGAALIAVIAFLAWPSGRNDQTAQTNRAEGTPTLSRSEQPTGDQQAALARQQEEARRTQAESVAAARRVAEERSAREAQARQQQEAQQRAEADDQRRRQAEATAAAEQQRAAQERAEREQRTRREQEVEEQRRRQVEAAAAAEQQRLAQERLEREQRVRREQEAEEQRRRQAEAAAAAEQQRVAQERIRRDQEAEEQRRRQAEADAAAEQQRVAQERARREQEAEEQRRRQAEIAAADLRMALERAERDQRLKRDREQEEQRQREAESAAGQKPQVAARTDTPGVRPALIQDCSQCPDLTPVPGGIATIGSNRDPSERPARTVPVKAFLMSRVPVTVGQWRECVRAGGCAYEPKGDDRNPVNNVNFDDAQQYIAWLSKATRRDYRLPTEAEWEYAARAGAKTRYWWGDEFSADYASCRKCGPTRAEPWPAGTFRPNAFGLQDMTGSVGQWVSDCWHKDYRGAPKDASSWSAGRCREQVVRGGSWSSEPADQTVSSRSFYDPGVRHPSYGFRVVRSP